MVGGENRPRGSATPTSRRQRSPSREKHPEAEAAFARLASDSTMGLSHLGPVERGVRTRRDRSEKRRVAAYDAMSGDGSVCAAAAWTLPRSVPALILVDSAPLNEMVARLEPLTGPDATFRHTARELLALAGLAHRRHGEARVIGLILSCPRATRRGVCVRASKCSWRCCRRIAGVEGEPMGSTKAHHCGREHPVARSCAWRLARISIWTRLATSLIPSA